MDQITLNRYRLYLRHRIINYLKTLPVEATYYVREVVGMNKTALLAKIFYKEEDYVVPKHINIVETNEEIERLPLDTFIVYYQIEGNDYKEIIEPIVIEHYKKIDSHFTLASLSLIGYEDCKVEYLEQCAKVGRLCLKASEEKVLNFLRGQYQIQLSDVISVLDGDNNEVFLTNSEIICLIETIVEKETDKEKYKIAYDLEKLIEFIISDEDYDLRFPEIPGLGAQKN